MSRRARERANARPWEQDPEPEDHRHDGDFPERCPDTDDMFGDEDEVDDAHADHENAKFSL